MDGRALGFAVWSVGFSDYLAFLAVVLFIEPPRRQGRQGGRLASKFMGCYAARSATQKVRFLGYEVQLSESADSILVRLAIAEPIQPITVSGQQFLCRVEMVFAPVPVNRAYVRHILV
jgi:hypothetical protein